MRFPPWPTCYACCRKATTSEHVPPKAFFPRGRNLPRGIDLRRNLITVPSCSKHNTDKADDDEYLLFVIGTSWETGPVAQHHYFTQLRPVILAQPRVRAFFNGAKPIVIDGQVTGMYEVEQERVERVLSLIARAIYFHHFGRRWKGELVLTVPPFMRLRAASSSEYAKMLDIVERGANSLFRDEPKHGANPSVFYYQVHQEPSSPEVFLRLAFYELFAYTAIRKQALRLASHKRGDA
jgi:hypothetical protein